MSETVQHGMPKLPDPIRRIWLTRALFVLLACTGYALGAILEEPGLHTITVALGAVTALALLHGLLIEHRLIRQARQSNLKRCASCCTPFDSDEPAPCAGCGRTLAPREEQRRWRLAALTSLPAYFKPKPKSLRIFPHWSIPLAILLLWLGLTVARQPIENRIWPPNTQTTRTFTVPNSGKPPRSVQIPVPAHPPTAYLVVISMAGLLVIIGMPTYIAIRQPRVTKRLRFAVKHGFLICEQCSYPLPDQDHGNCSECGRAYERLALRQRWYTAYGLYFRNQAVNMTIPLTLNDPLHTDTTS